MPEHCSPFRVRHGDRLDFLADSDAALVRGLIGILQRVYAGQNARQVLAFDIESFCTASGSKITSAWAGGTGLEGMIKKVRELASAIVKT